MDVNAYFTYLAKLMKTNPPAAEDAPMVANMAKIGLVPGQDFDPSKLGRIRQGSHKGGAQAGPGKDHGIRQES